MNIPDRLEAGCATLASLRKSGKLDEIAHLIGTRRRGYGYLDAFVLLVLFFQERITTGLRGFCRRCGDISEMLGALAGRASLMSSSSLSRVLAEVDITHVLGWMPDLVQDISGILRHVHSPSVRYQDANGEDWTICHFDVTDIAMEQRDIKVPAGEPPPVRLSDRLGGPGYAGRKRGNRILQVGMLTHQGLGAVLDASLQPGERHARELFGRAVGSVLAFARRAGLELARIVLVSDGEFGGVPYLTACIENNLASISRYCSYKLLSDPDVQARLRAATWRRVPSANGGPARYAADLGMVTLHAAESTRRQDGTRYAPVRVRMVVSLYARPRKGKGRGCRLGGHVFELFTALGLGPDSWPPEDVVSAFYARAGQENRFAQIQREFDFQRIFSYHPGGQLFALAVVFFLWNLWIAQGLDLGGPLPAPPPAPLRVPEPVPSFPMAEILASIRPRATHREEAIPPAPAAPRPSAVPTEEVVSAVLREALNGLPWEAILRKRQGWQWDPARTQLVNPQGVAMDPVNVVGRGQRLDLAHHGSPWRDVFRTSVVLPPGTGAEVARALEGRTWLKRATKARRKLQSVAPVEEPVREVAALSTLPPSTRPGHYDLAPAVDAASKAMSARAPIFRPVAAREKVREAVKGCRTTVRLGPKPPKPPQHPLIEPSPARRRHERMARSEHLAIHALPPERPVKVTFWCRTEFREYLASMEVPSTM